MTDCLAHPLVTFILFLTACWLLKKVFVDD
jgi:hypothetical protein